MVGMPGKVGRLIAIAAILAGIAGCSGTNQNPTAQGDVVIGGGVPGATFFGINDRDTVKNVSGETLQGKPISLSSYRGKTVVVDYWSSTCVPCDAEAQSFEALSKSLAPKGVQFIGIDLRDNKAAALNFERAHHITYPSIFDPTDNYLLDFPGAVPSTTPFTIVIDPDGGIAAKVATSLDYTTLRSFLHRAMSESA